MRASNIADVAAAAGVSPTTVSHALSGKRPVSAATRERVLKAIEELDYRPNLVAAGLRKQRTHTVALLVADIANPYYPSVARAIQDDVTAAGYVTLIGNTDGEPQTERTLLREMLARGADGVIMQPMSTSAAEIRQIVGPNFPLVLISDSGQSVADSVGTDDAVGIGDAVRYVVSLGIRELGFVSGPDGRSPGTARLAAFKAAVQALDLPVRNEWIAHTPFTRDGGFTAGQALLSLDKRPNALLCANDLIAIGVLDAARTAHLAVPEELAVIGFDDIETADLVTPRLTTIVNPAALIGEACAKALLRRIELGPTAPYQRAALRTSLVVRTSA